MRSLTPLLRQSKIRKMNEAETLFTDILNCDRPSLYLKKDLVFGRAQSLEVSHALKRRILGEPIQYILGKQCFMGLEFKVGRDVLIPRPETEILVQTALRYASKCKAIMDLGTGSGCIAVSLAKLLPHAKITAVDISPKALSVARENSELNGVSEKIAFIQSDLFSSYELKAMSYELIISNPPYIAAGEFDSLQPEVRFEPRIALYGGKDGLDFYRRIIQEAPVYLKKDGLLMMEMGYNQSKAIRNILRGSGIFAQIEVIKDYNNIDRVIVAKKGNTWIN